MISGARCILSRVQTRAKEGEAQRTRMLTSSIPPRSPNARSRSRSRFHQPQPRAASLRTCYRKSDSGLDQPPVLRVPPTGDATSDRSSARGRGGQPLHIRLRRDPGNYGDPGHLRVLMGYGRLGGVRVEGEKMVGENDGGVEMQKKYILLLYHKNASKKNALHTHCIHVILHHV